MIIWKSINDTEGKAFKLGHPCEEAQTEVRKRHYANSRQALITCLKEFKESPPQFTKASELLICGHHHLATNKTLLVSLAHTRGLAVACVAKESKEILGVGIDCELLNRPFRPELLSKFSRVDDSFKDPLHLWCAKEAAFKASSYFWTREKTFVLKDISIQENNFFVEGLLEGKLSYEVSGNYLITLATVTQAKQRH